MAKGNIAKQTIISKLATVFDSKFLGTIDNKTYIMVADEGGEEVAVAVTLTCPKTLPAGLQSNDTSSSLEVIEDAKPQSNYQLTQEEEKTISEMLASLGF